MRTRGQRFDRVEQRALDLAARHVRGVRHAAGAVAALEVQVEVRVTVVPRLGLVESGADALERPHPRRAFGHADLHGPFVAEACAGLEGVVDVRGEGVARAEDGGDAPLRVLGVGLVGAAFGEHENVAVRGGLEREGEASDAAADDEIVCGEGHEWEAASAAAQARGYSFLGASMRSVTRVRSHDVRIATSFDRR